ncbi:uncharacterized protein KY384_001191 [Bacidia gigantensis]|uniref:uncharacterized protein n=1 Tax=Bacidia gigantensis TaxID=2732470 RepID=UPI001D045FB6|nr:uncharacterized protein KY384_001191 [Bacidia gigantensis]KAG8534347.1 hypothetical protein KY384_001191 [Bacidia gigantensis]
MSESSLEAAHILLFLDFDNTLTTASTLEYIASIATTAKLIGDKQPALHPKLTRISQCYKSDLARHNEAYNFKKEQRRTLAHEAAYLDSLKHVEAASLDRVVGQGLFKGVTPQMVEEVAQASLRQKHVSLRKGWQSLIGAAQATGVAYVISVAWSKRFIEHILRASDPDMQVSRNAATFDAERIAVNANDIAEDGSGLIIGSKILTGRRILTSTDKLEVMRKLAGDFTENSLSAAKFQRIKTIYVGDSMTDLECLMEADLSICIQDEPPTRDQEQLAQTLHRLGVALRPISQRRMATKDRKVDRSADWAEERLTKTVWIAKDFEEISQYGLYGL